MRNFDLKEQIRDYWSEQAPVFDRLAAHRIEDRYGMPEWHGLLRSMMDLDPAATLHEKKVLDLACGTGEISRVLCELGAEVTGVDFSEEMLDVASAKLAGRSWTGVLSDAETLASLLDEQFDIAICRHLAWTLTEPQAAYRAWRRVLKPNGLVIIIDGNWKKGYSLRQRLANWLAERLDPALPDHVSDRGRHADIMNQLPYGNGLSAKVLREDLAEVGFEGITEFTVRPLYARGMRAWPLAERLRQTAENRFGIIASKPAR